MIIFRSSRNLRPRDNYLHVHAWNTRVITRRVINNAVKSARPMASLLSDNANKPVAESSGLYENPPIYTNDK